MKIAHSRTLLLVAAFAVGATLNVACSSAPRPMVSGFIGGTAEYKLLQRSELAEDTWTWRAEGSSLANYSRVMVKPIEVWPAAGSHFGDHDQQQIRDLAEFFCSEVERIVGARYPIAQSEGKGVLVMEAAITDVMPAVPLLNMGPLARVHEAGAGGAKMEAIFKDGGTDERVGLVLASAKSTEHLRSTGRTKWEQPKEVCTYWATLIRKRMDAEHGAE